MSAINTKLFRPWEDKSAKPKTVMDELASNPAFRELSATLQGELKCPSATTILDSLHNFSTTPKLEEEQQVFDVFLRCMTYDPVRVNMLFKFYSQQCQNIEMERRRYILPGSPFSLSANKFYDQQRHQLLARVKKSLALIEDTYTKLKVSAGSHNTSHDSSGYCSNDSAHEVSTSSHQHDSNQPLDLSVSVNVTPTRASQQWIPRKSLNPQAIHLLSSWYEAHISQPYPTPQEIEHLADSGNISPAQVKKWFSNKRFRSRNIATLSKRIVPRHLVKSSLYGVAHCLPYGHF